MVPLLNTLYNMCAILGQCPLEVSDEEKENPRLQRAFEEMKRLDEILSAKTCIEKEVKRQRKELQAKLWQELMVDSVCIRSINITHTIWVFLKPKNGSLISSMV